jgi:hypothetical protein
MWRIFLYEKREVIMDKAILVIDMPDSCRECPFFGSRYADMCCKGMNNRSINYPYPEDFRQDWCPLKPAPEKINVPDFDNTIKAESENAFEVGAYMYDRGYYRGYNACIERILWR